VDGEPSPAQHADASPSGCVGDSAAGSPPPPPRAAPFIGSSGTKRLKKLAPLQFSHASPHGLCGNCVCVGQGRE
jgi:hypothetical protein